MHVKIPGPFKTKRGKLDTKSNNPENHTLSGSTAALSWGGGGRGGRGKVMTLIYVINDAQVFTPNWFLEGISKVLNQKRNTN